MTYYLKRVSDGAGDAGPMSDGYYQDSEGKIQVLHQTKPEIGMVMRVGTPFSRSYSSQDWWQTTKIIEILENSGDTVRFKTENSEYSWKED